MNYRSRVILRDWKFCLPYSRDIQRMLLSIHYGHVIYVYGTFTSMAVPFQTTYFNNLGKNDHTTCLSVSIRDSVCPSPFSFATTHGVSLISFPPLLRCFNSGVPYHYCDYPLRDRKSHSGIADPWHSCASPQLIAKLVDLLRYSSRASPRWVVATECVCTTPVRVTLRYPVILNLDIIERPSPRRAALLVNLPQTYMACPSA